MPKPRQNIILPKPRSLLSAISLAANTTEANCITRPLRTATAKQTPANWILNLRLNNAGSYFSFSKRGGLLNAAIGRFLAGIGCEAKCCTMPKFAGVCEGLTAVDDYKAVCAEYFNKADALIFIGASGIAVRAIAPYVKSKTTDPAVLVIDECANFVISLLSGHIGGANGLARQIAAAIKAVPVVTTATDVNKLFAVDEWAARRGMVIESMQAAKDFAAALVAGKTAGLCSDYTIKGALPSGVELAGSGETGMAVTTCKNKKPFNTTVVLMPKILHLGIGCRRNTPLEK